MRAKNSPWPYFTFPFPSTLEVLSTGWPDAHSCSRVLLRRMRGGVWPTPSSTFDSLWYFFSVIFFDVFFLIFIFSIGHVLCDNCCLTIVEKTSPRASPVCPFCREPFTSDTTRLIRMDFTSSGWSTPRRFPVMESFNDSFNTEVLQRKTERLLSSVGSSKARPEVRRLEEKVARIAAKKCSVEEVSSLYTELDSWLRSEKDDQVRSPAPHEKIFTRLRHP